MPQVAFENVCLKRARPAWWRFRREFAPIPEECLSGGEEFLLDGVSFTLEKHRSLALVGDRDSGKQVAALALLKMLPVDGGRILHNGTDIAPMSRRSFHRMRRSIQAVFPDRFGQLRRDATLDQGLREMLRCWQPGLDGDEVHGRIERVMVEAGLAEPVRHLYPEEMDPVERQAAALARAMLCDPELLVCIDPAAGLGAVERAEVLNRISDLRETRGLTLLLTTDDLAEGHHMGEEIAVMHRGRIVEKGAAAELVGSPEHEYTRLLASCSL